MSSYLVLAAAIAPTIIPLLVNHAPPLPRLDVPSTLSAVTATNRGVQALIQGSQSLKLVHYTLPNSKPHSPAVFPQVTRHTHCTAYHTAYRIAYHTPYYTAYHTAYHTAYRTAYHTAYHSTFSSCLMRSSRYSGFPVTSSFDLNMPRPIKTQVINTSILRNLGSERLSLQDVSRVVEDYNFSLTLPFLRIARII